MEFVTFGKKDYNADFLLWFRFGNQLQKGTINQIEVLVCPSPKDHLEWWEQHQQGKKLKDRVTLKQLEKSWNGDIIKVKIDLDFLLED